MHRIFALLFFMSAVTAELQDGLYRIFNTKSGTTLRSNAVGAPLFVSTDQISVLYELVSLLPTVIAETVDLSCSTWHIVGGEADSQKSTKYLYHEEYRPRRMGS